MKFFNRRMYLLSLPILVSRFSIAFWDSARAGDDLTDRIADILNQGTDGTSGLYLKRVGGSVLAAEDETFAFYPASTIKVLKHLYGMRQVEAGALDLDATLVFVCPSCSDCASCDMSCLCTPACSQPCNSGVNCTDGIDSMASCGAPPDILSLRCVLQRMMYISDNQATNAMQNLFGNGDAADGRDNLNDLANNIVGMSASTALYHKFACGNVSNNPFNITTLADLGLLYEKVATDPTVLDPGTVPTFYQLMLNENLGGLIGVIQNVIDAEAATLGVSGADADVQALKSSIRLAYKAGNIGSSYVSIAGWIEVPFVTDCEPSDQEYVFGLFIHGAMNNTISLQSVVGELLRDELRAALQTVLCDRPPLVVAPATLIVECNAAGGAAGDDPQILEWLEDAAAVDDCDGDVPVTHSPIPGFLPVDCESENPTEVTFTAVDACLNEGEATSTITVVDMTTPVVTCCVSDAVLWPPNHGMVDVGLDFSVTDACDMSPVIELQVTSDESANAAPGAGGAVHCPDAVIANDHSVQLRAERSGKGNGRVYEIKVMATDACGNIGSCQVQVTVPHHPGPGGAAVDSGQTHDATACP